MNTQPLCGGVGNLAAESYHVNSNHNIMQTK